MYLCLALLIVALFLFIYFITFEHYTYGPGTGKSFSQYYKPQPCLAKNNCFRGSYYDDYLYNNMCEPQEGLLKQKRQLTDTCLRTHGDMTSKNLYFTKIPH